MMAISAQTAEKATQHKMVSLLECRLELHRRLLVAHSIAGPAARLSGGIVWGCPQETEMLQRDILSTGQVIDSLIYQ
jgi:hypothetical protein